MIRQPLQQARGMFTDYTPNRGYDEYFSANDQPRLALRPLLLMLLTLLALQQLYVLLQVGQQCAVATAEVKHF